ncbi:MAG: Holliday junction resolvase RuvX [Thermosipho sp. (in: Bacteria)]|nr:Holliday junction resolvase RuvX [Thermosipho sp. (in: thermotogales)]
MIVAIDYGESKSGYAIGERFINKSGTIKTKEIDKIINNIETVILGMPISMSGNYSNQSFKVLKYAEKLLKKGYKVYLFDERLTTKMAASFGIKDDDAFSARQIFLDYVSNPNIAQRFEILKEFEKKIDAKGTVLYFEVLPLKSVRGDAFTKNYSIAYVQFKMGNFVFGNEDTIEDKYDTVVTCAKYRKRVEKFLKNNGKTIII